MSWSIQKIGTKEAVKAACVADLDKSAANYEGHEEQKDVFAAKERIIAAIDGIDFTPDAFSSHYGVQVTASGSASKYSMSMQVSVMKVALLLD